MVGVSDKEGNTKKRMCTLHCVGDWQWLAKAGHLTRSYANCEKRPRAEQGVARGRCHMCQAGQDQVGWENFQLTTPAWWPTIFREDAFWGSPSPQSGCCSTRFRTGCLLHIDLFHSFHLGVGKTCVASCLCLATELMSASQVNERCMELLEMFHEYTAESHVTPYVSQPTRGSLGWPDKSSYPNGIWSKGHTTRTLSDFFEWLCNRVDISGSELLVKCRKANFHISTCLGMLYSRDVWIGRPEAFEIAGHGGTASPFWTVIAIWRSHAICRRSTCSI